MPWASIMYICVYEYIHTNYVHKHAYIHKYIHATRNSHARDHTRRCMCHTSHTLPYTCSSSDAVHSRLCSGWRKRCASCAFCCLLLCMNSEHLHLSRPKLCSTRAKCFGMPWWMVQCEVIELDIGRASCVAIAVDITLISEFPKFSRRKRKWHTVTFPPSLPL